MNNHNHKKAFNVLLNDNDFIKQLEELYPIVNWLNKSADQYPAGASKGEVIEIPTRIVRILKPAGRSHQKSLRNL